ncbi:AVAST type 1 anti-phage system MBL fold metallo-hydrolase Avs1a [Cupriavidus basilensis]|uniref:AVAST type 1 anti-phage system MBL fold metallo-hydrolase Avs1a n=1 Tax=Cupriavidus basilensis TaxID=68895 RepID=UPI0023E82972|nr:AVAST type 1 anti-phage system MBL fold metallo-hydrolase Avs1a [Cupriavidus basilensis]MDF3885519.1 MBL fold metallo-hydrolase [Cupriavidus basilensis]
MLRLKMYPARNGDAFLVDASGSHILIDAGFASTFNDHIAPDLRQLAHAGGQLDLLVCTHIDGDHIGGLLEFISSNGAPGARSIVEVKEVWHNSLRSLPSPPGPPDSASDRQVLEAIRRRGFLLPPASGPTANPISAKQGSSLAKRLKQHDYLWNASDGTTSMTSGRPPHTLPNGVQVRLIGPTVARLEELRTWWILEMRRLSYKGGAAVDPVVEDAYEMVCAYTRQPAPAMVKTISAASTKRLNEVYVPDISPTNGSSIATLIESEGKRLLFLGDAWAEDIVVELKRLHGDGGPHLFDAIKVSHHGSIHNTSVDLLSLIDAPIFLVSSNGSIHHHPDYEVLAEIVDRPATFERKIYFNYETPASTRLRAHVSRSGAKFQVDVVQDGWIHV